MKDLPEHTISSGNVYADLGFENPDLELAKAKLALRISDIIDERGLTQTAAAQILGIDQAHVSRIVRGRLGAYSLEKLMQLLVEFDQNVEIIVTPADRHGQFMATVPMAAD
jgi:predicted XRE-type DNA-binding protein